MRIILSEGQVNIFNLAKTRARRWIRLSFYAHRNLPLSREMAVNLQSFGGE
jgi:hypothetical protein